MSPVIPTMFKIILQLETVNVPVHVVLSMCCKDSDWRQKGQADD